MTMQDRATLATFKTLRRVAGVSVTINRGVSTGTVVAVPGDTLVDRQDEDGGTVRAKVRDYIVLRSDFEGVVGAGEKPIRGDKFVEVVADYTRTFETIELAGEIFRWWDKGGQVLRIHTVEAEKVTTTTGGA
jgi:hypothetical protein